MFASDIVDLISKASPIVGVALGGPLGRLLGSLISNILGVDMHNHDQVNNALQNPDSAQKLKELEIQLTDLQNARIEASKDQGYLKLVRPILILLAHLVLVVNVYLITVVEDQMLITVLIVFMYVLVSEIRQMYKFYFGSGEDITPKSL